MENLLNSPAIEIVKNKKYYKINKKRIFKSKKKLEKFLTSLS